MAADGQLNLTGDGNHLTFDKDDYAMVVIDEAQAYRNPDTIRAAALRKLLEGTPTKDLVLLTATPVNNSLWDLYYLLSYFIRNDAAFAHAGIRSLIG
jgi:SNF2 family DNA or RNA helicase